MKPHGIKQKMLLKTSIVVLITYTVLSLSALIFLFSALFQQLYSDNHTLLEQSEHQLSFLTENATFLSEQMILDEELDECVGEVARSRYPMIAATYVARLLNQYRVSTTDVTSVYLLTGTTGYSSLGAADGDYTADFLLSEFWFQEFAASDEKFMVSPVYEEYSNASTHDIISYVYKYNDIFSLPFKTQYLFINYSVDVLGDTLGNEDVLLVNDLEQVLSSSVLLPDEKINLDAMHDRSFVDGSLFILEKQVDNLDMTLYLPVELQPVYSSILSTMMPLLCISLLSLIVLLVVLSTVLTRTLHPLEELTQTMQASAKGNFDQVAEISTGDEVEVVADVYNELIENLQQYIQKLAEDERLRKQMQEDLFMSQIQPHFIYNTLNSIIYLVEEEENDKAINTIYSLIFILQNAVKLGNHELYTNVKMELFLVHAYLDIQTMRYPDCFTYEVVCDKEVESLMIPQIIIQPLVENAITHGILPKESGGHLQIEITQNEQNICIRVTDNGVGIPANKLADVFSLAPKNGHHIGLFNIKNRLSYLYPDALVQTDVQSEVGKGTTITLTFPRT